LCGIGDFLEIAPISMSDPADQMPMVYLPSMYWMKQISTVRSRGGFPPY
jgi:hypothetical protein